MFSFYLSIVDEMGESKFAIILWILFSFFFSFFGLIETISLNGAGTLNDRVKWMVNNAALKVENKPVMYNISFRFNNGHHIRKIDLLWEQIWMTVKWFDYTNHQYTDKETTQW